MKVIAVSGLVLDCDPGAVSARLFAFSLNGACGCRRVYCNLEVLPSNYQVCVILQPPVASRHQACTALDLVYAV